MFVLLALIGLGVLIFVHELGHFMAAKAVGIAVPRFSIGLGPITPLRLRRGETEYVVSWIPFGGYVKMASREEQEQMAALEGGASREKWPPHRLFESQSLAARILVISAGVIMNALFAWAVYAAILGFYGAAEDPTTRVARVESQSLPEAAAALAEMPPGARVVRVGGQPVDSWDDITVAILDPPDGSNRLSFEFAAAEPVTIDAAGLGHAQRLDVVRALVPMWEARFSSVSAGQPAATAGLVRGDLVTAVDGVAVDSWDAMVRTLESRGGEEIRLAIRRGEETREVTLTPAVVEAADPLTGETREVGRIGVSGPLIEPLRVHYGPGAAILAGARQTWSVTRQVLGAFGAMVGGRVSLRELGGPIRIVQISGELARVGLEQFLAFLAFLSVNLAILNLLPIPVLDGGHLVFLFLEGLRGGRPLPVAVRERLTLAGFYLLLALMVFVIFNDLIRL